LSIVSPCRLWSFLSSNIDPDNLYKRASQRETFATLLSDTKLGEKYISIDDEDEYVLSKGHLAGKADFFYATGQRVTYSYANALPQWFTANRGNWETLEKNLRTFAKNYGHDLEVYAGGTEHFFLPDIHNNRRNIFLNTNQQMPVPRMLWKIVYDPTSHAGIAFITLNNPYETENEAKADVWCKDISAEVKWLTWKRKDLVLGYSYACDVNQFRSRFSDMPEFTVNKILK
jgi:DNA/RNA endonuclease G (NUC1)